VRDDRWGKGSAAGPTGELRASGEGKNSRLKRKENGPRLGRKAGWAESDEKILFRIKFNF
jgi:hypothetical protein